MTRWTLSLLALLVAGCMASTMDTHPNNTALTVGDRPNKWIRVPQAIEGEEFLWKGQFTPTFEALRKLDPLTFGPLLSPSQGKMPWNWMSPSQGKMPWNWIDEKTIREYQKTLGLPETGQFDSTTLKALSDLWNKVTNDPPTVSIGRPKAWPLSMVLPLEKMSPLIQTRLQEADFYLVQLFCSFRPAYGDARIESARFDVFLLPDLMGRQPIAIDLIPTEVTKEVKRQAKFTLAPTLKFQEVEAQGANIEWGIEYRELQPIIVGAGTGESHATWTYQTATGIRGVYGGKGMYLIVEAPKGMETAYARLKLEAQIRGDGIAALWDWVLWRRPTQDQSLIRLW